MGLPELGPRTGSTEGSDAGSARLGKGGDHAQLAVVVHAIAMRDHRGSTGTYGQRLASPTVRAPRAGGRAPGSMRRSSPSARKRSSMNESTHTNARYLEALR